MKASTVPRRRHAALRRERRRSITGAPGAAGCAVALTSRNLSAPGGRELRVDLLVEVREPGLEVVALPRLVLRDEGVRQILVRAPDDGHGRRPRVRVGEDLQEDVEVLVGLDAR